MLPGKRLVLKTSPALAVVAAVALTGPPMMIALPRLPTSAALAASTGWVPLPEVLPGAPVTVLFHGSFSGPGAPQSTALWQGAVLGAELFKGSRPVDLLTVDDRGEPARAGAVAREATGLFRPVAVLLGPAPTLVAPALAAYREAGVPVIRFPAPGEILTDVGDSSGALAMAPGPEATAGAAIRVAADTLGAARIALVSDATPAAQAMRDRAASLAVARGLVVALDEPLPPDPATSGVVGRIITSGAQAVWLAGPLSGALHLASAARSSGLTVPFVLAAPDPEAISRSIPPPVPAAFYVVQATRVPDDLARPAGLAFVDAYRRRWGKPPTDLAPLQAADAVHLLGEAGTDPARWAPAELLAAMHHMASSWAGASGPIGGFDTAGRRQDGEFTLYTLNTHGQWAPVRR